MYRWRHLHFQCRHLSSPLRRVFSTKTSIDSVLVRCGSSGHVAVDLHNFSNLARDEPIVIHLPPLPDAHDAQFQLPSFLRGLPVASIRYRWDGFTRDAPALLDDVDVTDKPQSPAPWPTPVHDTAFAFGWLSQVFAPEDGRRGVYVYGSFLGAGLAASLAITEANPDSRFAVQGLMAYNGIYNWTMFLPDHRVNRTVTRAGRNLSPSQPRQGSHLHFLQQQMPQLFGQPTHLFDVFASPSLFFHSPGLYVPRSFTMTMAESAAIDAMAGQYVDLASAIKMPRKSHHFFPTRESNLQIPEALLLHDSISIAQTSSGQPHQRKTAILGNDFQAQAAELAELMRRSVELVELQGRVSWDDDSQQLSELATGRVQMLDVGESTPDYELSAAGQKAALTWLQDRDVTE